mgnify:FL=1|jgi:hypothetical protein|tara:strand:+ start:9457 stop:9723 length:267 start_codon:yes stop_codon:yes gene_type:complete
MKLLTKERIRGIIEQFINNCENNDVTRFGFDESFWETTSWCEEHWEDDDSEEMKRSLLDNYLMQFGYHVLEEEGALSKEELIENYFIN